MRDSLWNMEINGYRVLYTNLRGVAYTATLKIFRLKFRKDYLKYKAICLKGHHYIGVPLYSKNVICVPVKENPEDEPSKKYLIKGLKNTLRKKWDKPLIIPYIYTGIPPEDFKKLVMSLNQGNNEIKLVGM